MPDYLRDFSEIVMRGEGSALKRDQLLRSVRKLDRKLRGRGVDINSQGQRKFCDALGGDSKEWMFRLCLARLTRGDFSDWTGWEYRNTWAEGSYSPEVPNKRWRLEPVKSIAVLGEQGIGDEIMFAGCLPDLMKRVPEVVVECEPRLVPIFQRSFGIECKGRNDVKQRGKEVIQYLTLKRPQEVFIPIGDLPRLFRKDQSHFPRVAYIKPLPEMVEKWGHLKGRVGLAWRSRTHQLDPHKLMKATGVENPVCLQYDLWQYEAEGMTVPDCDLRDDVEDILGICWNLERIVTVPQTVVHFAGSMGKKVDVVKGNSGRVKDMFAYRYTDPMVWYKDVKVHESIHAYRG